jgi:DNA modification methylase
MNQEIENVEQQVLGNVCSIQSRATSYMPFYSNENITIYNADCLTVMPALRPLNGIIVTDPPYGIGETNEQNATRIKLAKPTNFGSYDWDKKKVEPIYFQMMKYISRHQIIFGGNYYDLGGTKSYIVWDKDNGENDFADCELAWTSFDKAVRKIKHRWNGMLQQNMKEKEKRLHPTQKPLPVMIEIIESYTNASDVIIDPFMGSGTTLVAAATLGRKAVGIEINPDYCNIAVKRLQTIQTRMTV